MRHALTVAAAVVLLGGACPASADLLDLESGFPLEIEDPYPIGYLGREAQLRVAWERTADDRDRLTVVPRIELGFPRNAQLSVAQRFQAGDAEPNGVGPMTVEFLYNVNQETLILPSLGLVALADFPTGNSAHGVDAGGKVLLTKTVGRTWHLHRVHLNGAFQVNDDVRPPERGVRYEFAIGYSTVLTNELLFVTDFFRQTTFTAGDEENLAEVGVRWAVTPRLVLSAGIGVGVGDESPEVRPVLAAQVAF